jgi:hypothetical protein
LLFLFANSQLAIQPFLLCHRWKEDTKSVPDLMGLSGFCGLILGFERFSNAFYGAGGGS